MTCSSPNLCGAPRNGWVTGAAGFIGSHLVETLLGLDNFATGHQANLDDVRAAAGERAWQLPVSGFYNVRKKVYKVWMLWTR
jgi:nucleoside-diphosphate-sugar epimerase